VPYVENANVTAAQALMGQGYDEAKARRAFTEAILDTPGALAVTSMSLVFNTATRRLAITWSASTQFGDVTSSVEP